MVTNAWLDLVCGGGLLCACGSGAGSGVAWRSSVDAAGCGGGLVSGGAATKSVGVLSEAACVEGWAMSGGECGSCPGIVIGGKWVPFANPLVICAVQISLFGVERSKMV